MSSSLADLSMRFLGLFGFADINSFQTGCTAFVFAVMGFRMRLRYNTLDFSSSHSLFL